MMVSPISLATAVLAVELAAPYAALPPLRAADAARVPAAPVALFVGRGGDLARAPTPPTSPAPVQVIPPSVPAPHVSPPAIPEPFVGRFGPARALNMFFHSLRLFGGPGPVKPGSKRAELAVEGTVVFEVSVISGDVRVERGAAGKVEIEIDADNVGVALDSRGSRRVAAHFGHDPSLRTGDVLVKLPAGSDVVVRAVSGDIEVLDVGGQADARSVSGEVTVRNAKAAVAESVNGDVAITGVSGEVSVQTVSGEIDVVTTGEQGARLRFRTTSGDLRWRGRCGNGCRIEGETLSGEVELVLDSASSLELAFETFSGDLEDALGLTTVDRHGTSGRGVEVRGRYGDAAGTVRVQTFSGELSLRKHAPKK